MADTERPKRLRGAKLLEKGYRAGYEDGLRDAVAEIEARQAMNGVREARLQAGLDRLRDAKKVGPPKRRHRKTVAVDPRTDEQKLRDLAQERTS